MYQHILVPVDGSTTSDRALQEALKLARQQSAQLELVHVVEDMRLWDSDSYINYAELQ
ncbi:MAG: universal stress protein, partial [Nitrosospira sp.]